MMENTFTGPQLKTMRDNRGISQRILAKASGLCRTTVSRIETGRTLKPRVKTIENLFEALNDIPLKPIQGLFFEIGDGNESMERGIYPI